MKKYFKAMEIISQLYKENPACEQHIDKLVYFIEEIELERVEYKNKLLKREIDDKSLQELRKEILKFDRIVAKINDDEKENDNGK